MQKKTSVYENGLIWFGAAVSIAEILTGTYYASMDFSKAIFAIIIGHILGFVLLSLSGLIGAKTGRGAMDSTKLTFGKYGGMFFALVNFLQLVGWTAIMIYDGALSSKELFNLNHSFWAILIGVLIIVWLAVGLDNLGKINTISMIALFLLTILMSFKVFGSDFKTLSANDGSLSFGGAIELAIAMPLSWLPLISDYTSKAYDGKKSTIVSAGIYSLISTWMYIIGFTGALVTGESNLSSIFLASGIGIFAIIIIILSTVTTTFLDAYSAGISFTAIKESIDGKKVGIGVTIVGIIAAIIYPMDDITDFLYLISSIFAPMIAVQIADFFTKKDNNIKDINMLNLILWVIGFIIYRIFLNLDLFIGASLACIILTALLAIIIKKALKLS